MNDLSQPTERRGDIHPKGVMNQPRGRGLCGQSVGGLLLVIVGMATGSVQGQGVATNQVPRTTPVSGVSELSTGPAAGPRVGKEAEGIAQGRLVPTSQEKLIERHGFLGSVFGRSGRVNPLQLINPVAPQEYGGTGVPSPGWSWNPTLLPGQAPLPRSFQDPNSHEASAVVIRGSFR